MDGFIPNIRIINNLGARLGSISFKADKLLSAFFDFILSSQLKALYQQGAVP